MKKRTIGKFTVVRHRTARSVVRRYLGRDVDAEMFGTMSDGSTTSFTADDMICGVERMGMWGYSDTKRKRIHLWFQRGRVKRARLINFFTHEIFHLYGWPVPKDEEFSANMIGDIAEIAVKTATRYKIGEKCSSK